MCWDLCLFRFGIVAAEFRILCQSICRPQGEKISLREFFSNPLLLLLSRAFFGIPPILNVLSLQGHIFFKKKILRKKRRGNGCVWSSIRTLLHRICSFRSLIYKNGGERGKQKNIYNDCFVFLRERWGSPMAFFNYFFWRKQGLWGNLRC